MAQIVRELVGGVPEEQLRTCAAQVLDRVDTGRDREPGEDGSRPSAARSMRRCLSNDAHRSAVARTILCHL
jgi:hypothetical protein